MWREQVQRESDRAPARAVYTSVISDTCTVLHRKCKSFPVRLGHAAAGGNTVGLMKFYLYIYRERFQHVERASTKRVGLRRFYLSIYIYIYI